MQFSVFVSSTSSDLGSTREEMVGLLQSYCIPCTYQTEAKTTTKKTFDEIDAKITSSNLTICLIGDRFGTPLPKVVPKGVPQNLSWTQYEYWKAGEVNCPRWLLFYEPAKKTPQSPCDYESQRAFIQIIMNDRERGNSNDCFSTSFSQLSSLKSIVREYIERGTDPWLHTFRMERWGKAKAHYRKVTVENWNQEYPEIFRGGRNWKPDQKSPPFIENQRLDILDKKSNGIYLPHLSPAAFVNARQTDSEEEADKDNSWKPTSYDDIMKKLLKPKGSSGWERRMFFVSGGGVGKTEGLKRLVCKINKGENDATENSHSQIAFKIEATELFAGDMEIDVLELLATKICNCNKLAGGIFHEQKFENVLRKKAIRELDEQKYRIDEIKRHLMVDREQGLIALFIDGLDHLGRNRFPSLFGTIQGSVDNPWRSCPIVMSGRPYIIQSHFRDDQNNWEKRLLASRWRFIRPGEFDQQQQAVYLGLGKDEYNGIPREARKILSVPRTIKYARVLSPESLEKINTSVEIYCQAIHKILEEAMNGALEARAIDPHSKSDSSNSEVTPAQLRFVKVILSAAAMVMTKNGASQLNPNFDKISASDSFIRQVFARVVACGEIGYKQMKETHFRKNFVDRLATLNTVVNNGIIEGPIDNTLQELIWDNKSVQCFFAAYWLANFAYTSKSKDCDLFRMFMIWYHESEIDDYYELNQFLAEMPAQHRESMNWLSCTKAWFSPPSESQQKLGFLRSSEMMYRAWPTLIELSNSNDRDWWNCSYESLFSGRIVQASRKSLPRNRNEQVEKLAFRVLRGFRGELDQIIAGHQGRTRARIAKQFTVEENWKTVSDGSYQMGSPLNDQGFPKKTERFWIRKLLSIINGASTRKVAEACNPQEWFRGAQGRRFRKEDVIWLKGVFDSLKQDAVKASVDDPAFKTAMTKILNNWRRKDESPLEKTQSVASFEMNRYPVLNEWFWLFASGHRNSVRNYLSKNNAAQVKAKLPENWNPNHGDHPVIFVSWFDAWAFCQWAHWTQRDAKDENNTLRFRCRLPHEAEWEFASRESSSGQIPFEQRYWWKDTFYKHELCSEACNKCDAIEHISNKFAHADGRPGRTRSPKIAQENGFGFCDILGNVWEWNANIYFDSDSRTRAKRWSYSRHLPNGKFTPPVNSNRAMRGGLWYFLDVLARCSSRYRLSSDDRDYKMGFRLVRERVSLD